MTTQPQTDARAAQISPEIEHAVRDFVRAAVSRLSEALNDQAPEWEVDWRWERGTDRSRIARSRCRFSVGRSTSFRRRGGSRA